MSILAVQPYAPQGTMPLRFSANRPVIRHEIAFRKRLDAIVDPRYSLARLPELMA
ncbi:hypothetical protein [Aurantimonas coralicida]|uniref:hypothetical protein n=1 Tax=Aurantimonas coralicida TaxID=182270 RepID=UPI00396A0B82